MPRLPALAHLERAGSSWVGIAALATALLYACGFFSLRGSYAVLGVDIELTIFDHRYVFAGARFTLYLLLFGIVLTYPLLLCALIVSRLRSIAPRFPDMRGGRGLSRQLMDFGGAAAALVLIVATFAALQLLRIRALLLIEEVPQPDFEWSALICGLAGYTTGRASSPVLVAGATFILAWLTLYWTWRRLRNESSSPALLTALLVLLSAVQLLMLPATQGALFGEREMRRLDQRPQGLTDLVEPVWLVYRGSTRAVVFGRNRDGKPGLVTVGLDALDGRAIVEVATSLRRLKDIKGCG